MLSAGFTVVNGLMLTSGYGKRVEYALTLSPLNQLVISYPIVIVNDLSYIQFVLRVVLVASCLPFLMLELAWQWHSSVGLIRTNRGAICRLEGSMQMPVVRYV